MRGVWGATVVYLAMTVFGLAGAGLVLIATADVVVVRLLLREIGARRREAAAPARLSPAPAAPPEDAFD